MSLLLTSILIIALVIIFYFIILVFTVLFRLTGLTEEKAKFQVISLLTNCGFTTSESEIITSNKTRRKLARITMLCGYSFFVIFVSLIVNLFFSFSENNLLKSFIICFSFLIVLIMLFLLSRNASMRKHITHTIEKIIKHKHQEKVNRLVLIDIYDEMVIAEIDLKIIPENLIKMDLSEANINENYNILILFLKRGNIERIPLKEDVLTVGDKIILFGPLDKIKKCFTAKL